MLLEVIPVILEQLELEIVRHVARRPGHRVRLIAAKHQPADLLLEIGAAVGIAQRRRIGAKTRDLLGDDVLMLHRLQRHRDAGHGADLPRPLAAAVDHRIAGDDTQIGADGFHPASNDVEALDARTFDNLRAMQAGALGE